LLANLAGLALGIVLSLLLIFVINKQSFGWTIQFHWPIAVLLSALTLVYVATVLAGFYPPGSRPGWTQSRSCMRNKVLAALVAIAFCRVLAGAISMAVPGTNTSSRVIISIIPTTEPSGGITPAT